MAKVRARTALRPTLISLAVASCFTAGTTLANPTGANVVRGTAAIHQAGNLLQITNSPNAIINWQSFSIGANEITRFLQQSPSSAVLNRVTTQNPSQILGSLQSRLLDGVTTGGRVFLINPNGILFGAGAQIDVGGLVASTLRMSDDDFLAGRMRFGDGLGKSVVNDGSIATGAGGSVYLIGSGVTNNGIIRSPQGEVVLAAGNSVELVSPGTPNLRVEIAATDNEARNLGQIISDAGRIGIYAGLINNSGTIRADSAVSGGGKILLKASKSATLESSSVLSAQGQGGGEIKVLADESVHVAGRLDASAPVSGNGGFIETSGKSFSIDPSAVITTAAPFGKTGTWLLDPLDFIIGPAGSNENITGTALSILLGQNNVVITSDGLVTPLPAIPGTDGLGDIFVNDRVAWASANSLTLTAKRNVDVNNVITNAGTGGINLNAGWDAITSTPDFPNLTPGTGNININANVTSQGGLQFKAGNNINITGATVESTSSKAGVSLSAGSNINITSLAIVRANNGNIMFSAPAGTITVDNSLVNSGDSGGAVSMSANTINIVNSNGTNGIVQSAPELDSNVTLTATNTITINNSRVLADGGSSAATVLLTAPNGITASNGSQIGAVDGTATVALSASAGPIMVSSSNIFATGGAGRDASVTLSGNGITVGSGVGAMGGSGGSIGTGGNATVTLNGGAGGITVQSSAQRLPQQEAVFLAQVISPTNPVGEVVAVGGNGGMAGGAGTVVLSATGGIIVNNATVWAAGGNAPSGSGGNAQATLTTGGNITLASNVIANGGSGLLSNGTGRIALFFLSSGTNFIVSNQPGVIFDSITGSGFMVDGLPAILNVNLFVTGGGPAFIDPLVAAMNQQVDVLADQLRAGETGEGEDKEKLPFCSG